ncbi:MAG: hypothetical protein QNL62_01515 [Gammaproteobacteria bacterium]|nr:hypothetical protein [Gammaproteobacteria bacterium]
MSELSILGTAQAGMQTGLNGIKKSALSIASKNAMQSPVSGQSSPVNDLVDMKMNQYQVQASGKVVETVDEILGSLLDEKT